MVEALLGGYPANGVVLHVQADSASSALGDAPINLLTLINGNWVVTQTRPMTLVQFQLPTNGAVGTLAEFIMTPAIAPLAFSASTTAMWQGEVLVNAGVAPAFTVAFNAAQVRERSADTADLIVGDGTVSGQFPQDVILTSTGVTHGRVTFNFGSFQVTTPAFNFDHVNPVQFRRNVLEFDEHDPAGLQPVYGASDPELMILHVVSPAHPQLDTFWAYQFALEVPVAENPSSLALAPASISVDLFSYDGSGTPVDSLLGISLSRIDNDGDATFINYRSGVDRPVIFVDQTVNKADFPILRILIVSDGGTAVIKRH